MLRTYKPSNPMMRFLKYKFNSKLLSGITFLIVISGVTWTQLYIYIYIYCHIVKGQPTTLVLSKN